MRTHEQIISDSGVPGIRRALAEKGVKLSDPTVRSWARRKAIPAPYWAPLVEAKITTLEELAASARVDAT